MISRSGSFRAVLVSGALMAAFSFGACGGKVVGVDGDDSSNNQPDGGGGDGGVDSGQCSEFGISCPVCEGDPNSGKASCVNGQWECNATKCEPPPDCNLSAPADCKCGTPTCESGEWVCPSDCSDTCPPDITGLAGTACSVEGLICGGEDCTNPCDFCNFIGCQSGVWTNEEAPPEPCPIDAGAPNGG